MTHEGPENWFEDVYAASDSGGRGVPWARMVPAPEMVRWLDRNPEAAAGAPAALVVGCGLGDDAEELARRGFRVTAFDVAGTAVALCRERFPGSTVDYRVAELFATPAGWRRAFPFVLEHRTVQSLPPPWQARAMAAVAEFVAPGGRTLVIADMRPVGTAPDGPPWRLRPRELAGFTEAGLQEVSFSERTVRHSGGRTRVTAVYERPADGRTER